MIFLSLIFMTRVYTMMKTMIVIFIATSTSIHTVKANTWMLAYSSIVSRYSQYSLRMQNTLFVNNQLKTLILLILTMRVK